MLFAQRYMSKHFAHEIFFFYNAYLGVSIIDVDVHCNHEENSDGDTKVSDQTTDLEVQCKKTTRPFCDCAR